MGNAAHSCCINKFMDKSPKEFSMKKHILLTLLTITLVTSILFVSCKTPDEKAAAAIEGTWVSTTTYGSETSTETYQFNDGNYEYTSVTKSPGYTWTNKSKGTFTVSGSLLTTTPTHVFNSDNNQWYSKADLKGLGVSDEDLKYYFEPEIVAFSLSGSTLYIGNQKFTKK